MSKAILVLDDIEVKKEFKSKYLLGINEVDYNKMVISGESPRRFFRWFWDFLREEKVFLPVFLLKSFILNCFSKCNLGQYCFLSFICRKYH